ncbi:MAG TPA: EI24 domain-containing protein [Sphingomicrobium sp.]|nr:EI24 domain-containing protein [Sphingomicrobium sp.]
MIRAIGLALADLGNGRVLAILLQAAAISLLIFLIIAGLLFWLLAGTDPCNLLGLGSCRLGIGGGFVGAISLTLLGAWFIFPAVAITVITAFSDRVARAVEERHYPAIAKTARPMGVPQGMLMGLRSASRLILFNLLALPFYLALLLTGVGPFILFVIVNGIAFGRDLAELAAARHGNAVSRREWLRQTRGGQHLIGVVVSVLFLVPVANLLAPVIGAAAGVHLFNNSFWTMKLGRTQKGRA